MKIRGLEFKADPARPKIFRCGPVTLHRGEDWEGWIEDARGLVVIYGATSTSTAEEQLDVLVTQTHDHLKAAKVFEAIGASVPW